MNVNDELKASTGKKRGRPKGNAQFPYRLQIFISNEEQERIKKLAQRINEITGQEHSVSDIGRKLIQMISDEDALQLLITKNSKG